VNDDDDQFLTNDPDDINPMAKMKDDERLPGDYNTPFSPPEGIEDRIDNTDPDTDDGIDSQEHYDAGIEAASGKDLPIDSDRPDEE
jgi:hypothetical protein